MSELSSQAITAQSGSNLALAFFCLTPERRRAMSIFYAFCRVIDDIADSEILPLEQKRVQLGVWREEIRKAYLSTPETTLGRELAEIIRTYLIPPTPLEEILNGVEMDLSIRRYQTFAELEKYCYRVASAVGLVSIEIFSYRQEQTREYAVALGLAFQLTNILRDVLKDASYDRIYLPLDEMDHFGVRESDLLEGRNTPAVKKLLLFQYNRAAHYFAKSLRLIHSEDRPHLMAAEIMREVYAAILEKVRADGFMLRNPPLKHSKLKKVALIASAIRREKKALPLPPRPKKVLILGGGLAGLSAAKELVLRGHQVTVLEGKGQLGGRAHSFTEASSGETLDNGQHILMGCYHETLDFLRSLGVTDKLLVAPTLEVPFVSAKGRSVLKAPSAPAPFHLLGALLGFGELGANDRWAALKMGVVLRLNLPCGENETALAWLKRHRQPANLIRALWEPLCLAALNQALENSSARLLSTVLRRALFAPGLESRLIFSRVGLSELFGDEVLQLLKMCGSDVRLNTHLTRLEFCDQRLSAVHTLRGEKFEADHIISALPWNMLRGLLPSESSLTKVCTQIPDSTIVSIYYWLDRPLEIPAVLGFLDSPLHWLFSREKIEGVSTPGRHVYVAVISAADALNSKTPQNLTDLVLAEIHRLLPQSRTAQVLRHFVYKAKSATFCATPQVEKLRPGSVTEWSNLWLAGDWTSTGLPATIEGAVASGRHAATLVDQSLSP